jgi:hyperosmotically inducible protein
MKQRLIGVSALALLAALAVTGCNRGDDATTTGSADTSMPPDTTADAPVETTPPMDTTAGAGERAGVALDDAAVTAKVKAALLATDGISGTDISVETQQGRVILTGKVDDQAEALRAAEVASNVEGVLAVDNRIEVSAS